MYKLSVKAEFSAAHNLRNYKGKCEELHGHNWKVEAVISAKKTDSNGLAMDFHAIKDILKETLEELDHKHLNQITYFKKNNPTSENIARYLFDKLDSQLKKGRVCLSEVTVWESDNCSATYSK
ncbi:MAG: 6-carboxytetrahydropterin synthase QueD [Candidatus Omnitrophota bacterium]|nr:6-carboxytetrahydropterin synthase QueD [Candidatus Omnitrophota bacterium]